jgi:hypothetical protein
MIATGSWNAGCPSDSSPTQSIAMCNLWSEAAVGGGDHVCTEAPADEAMYCTESGWNAVQESGIKSEAGAAAGATPVGADGALEELLFGRGWEEGGFGFESDVLRL